MTTQNPYATFICFHDEVDFQSKTQSLSTSKSVHVQNIVLVGHTTIAKSRLAILYPENGYKLKFSLIMRNNLTFLLKH